MKELFGNDGLNYTLYPEKWKLNWSQTEVIELLKEKAKELEDNLDIYDGLIV